MSGKGRIQKLIIRMLLGERELSGYDIWKELSMKGVRVRTNYLYMILAEMEEKEELLKGRWVESARGPRRHLYSLSSKGVQTFRDQLKESVDLIMAAFIHANLSSNNLPEHVNSVRGLFEAFEIPLPTSGSRFVLTTPSFDPLICYPISYYALSETFPKASISVVKPPGTTLYAENPTNMVFLDGRRHDMPLKDNFADYLMLEGFPKGVAEEDTVQECLRVLKKSDGHLIIRVPDVMTQEKRPKFSNLSEYASKLFYDFSGQDRIISVERLTRMLSKHADNLKQAENRGNILFYAEIGSKERRAIAALGSSRTRS